MRTLVLISVVGLACGASKPTNRVVDADDSNLADCKFVARVKGSAPDSDPNAETTAKNDARRKAAASGATHVRWIVPCCNTVEGDAFRCDMPE